MLRHTIQELTRCRIGSSDVECRLTTIGVDAFVPAFCSVDTCYGGQHISGLQTYRCIPESPESLRSGSILSPDLRQVSDVGVALLGELGSPLGRGAEASPHFDVVISDVLQYSVL